MTAARMPGAGGRPLRIGLVAACPFPALQGSQVLIAGLARGLAARGHQVHLISYGRGEGEALGAGVRTHSTGRLGTRSLGAGPHPLRLLLDVVLLFRLFQVARRERLDVLHAHNYEATILALMVGRWLDLPVIYHGHNAMGTELPTYFRSAVVRRAARWLGQTLDRHVPRRSDHCIAVTAELVPFLQARGVGAEALSFIAPGAEPAHMPARPESLRAAEGWSDRAVLVYAGNLDGYQNLGDLLDSFRRVVAAVPAALLVVVTHADAAECVRAARARGVEGHLRVVRVGTFEEVRDLLGVADVAVCSRTEWSGFPMKLLNYMAAGKPVVAFAGSAKCLTHCYDGWVVPDGDIEGFARALVALIQDPAQRRRLGENARRTVADQYVWSRVIEAVEQVYAAVLRRRAVARGPVRRPSWVVPS